MVVDDWLAVAANAHRREPHILNRKTALLDSLQAILQTAEIGIDVVRTERELNAALLSLADDVEAGDLIAGADLEGDIVLLQYVKHLIDALLGPILVVVEVHIVGDIGRIGEDVGGLVREDLDSLVNDTIHILLHRDATVADNLLGTVDARVTALMVDDGHSIGEEIVEDSQSLLREGLRPLAALALYAKEEGEFGVAFAIAAILMILTLLINLSATLVGKYFAKRRNV